jgi:hypothetical protein
MTTVSYNDVAPNESRDAGMFPILTIDKVKNTFTFISKYYCYIQKSNNVEEYRAEGTVSYPSEDKITLHTCEMDALKSKKLLMVITTGQVESYTTTFNTITYKIEQDESLTNNNLEGNVVPRKWYKQQ